MQVTLIPDQSYDLTPPGAEKESRLCDEMYSYKIPDWDRYCPVEVKVWRIEQNILVLLQISVA